MPDSSLSSTPDGKRSAETLLPLIYDALRQLARSRLARERPGQTLQPTALVHEAYLRLGGDASPAWDNPGHFFAAAAEAMRRILIERARRYRRVRHGGGQRRTTLNALQAGGANFASDREELLAVDQALTRLEARDAVMAQVVKMRYFAGLTVAETAAALETSHRSVNRLWTEARAWLYREVHGTPASIAKPPKSSPP
jgi:RNA polymerase sigma factor (TIGR02999 family)